ncbi:uncharacterized protein PV09_03404 [Verruconis gallopava]|uniref:Zn(2)-C6 fungal-type domain-containing protein n=1 Tax=Verruconis gallopava TaxID=253628 RepID=A0A0D2AEZ6_9PEZI|nr:uncharacterized protein PV09_03404 [Verruconis gallopava]KIW05523.1 hypothetical protein PV09_03404 [Verruconis gallopava]
MVYCGKPSRGCQNCKTRRIKCDEGRPCCGQCIKSKRECPGYPDEFDLIFRNETAAVKKRAQRAASTSSSKGEFQKPRRDSASPLEAATVWQDSPTRNSPKADRLEWTNKTSSTLARYNESQTTILNFEWQNPLESKVFNFSHPESAPAVLPATARSQKPSSRDVLSSPRCMDTPGTRMNFAITFFFRHLVQMPRSKDSVRGCLEVLGPMYMKARADSILHQATHAMALACLSNGKRSPLIRMEARKLYAKALRDTGEALQDPAQARSDELLMSILLFSMYETITSTDTSRMLWTRHINGAVALVKLRGEQMLSNPVSLHLFQTVRSNMLTSTIQQQRTVEDFPSPKGWHCDEDMDINAANRLTLICINLPNIKYYAQNLLTKEKNANTVKEMMKLIQVAKEVDSALEHWALTLSDQWEPRVKMTVPEEPEDVTTAQFWKGPVYVYADLSMASVWNDYRISRIFCQSVILGCVAALPSHLRSAQIQRILDLAVRITQQMVDDFCATVPYLFGLSSEFEANKVGILDQLALRATGAYYAAWPLWVTNKIPTVPEKQRQWLLSKFLLIGKTWGLTEEQMLNMAQRQAMTAGPQFSYEEYGELKRSNVSPRPCGAEYVHALSPMGTSFVGNGGRYA